MCSLNWRKFDDRIGLVFTRDESVLREKALPPQRFAKAGIEYLMPVDPVGKGSWIAVNNAGFIIALLNDYQGNVKASSKELISRGALVQQLACCSTYQEMVDVIADWPFKHSQPFYLVIISLKHQGLWHFNGSQPIIQLSLPQQLYSSGHPDVAEIKSQREAYAGSQVVNQLDDLLRMHQSHEPSFNNDLAYSFCMHREDAKSQSMTAIELGVKEVSMKYWQGQPCQADLASPITKGLSITQGFDRSA